MDYGLQESLDSLACPEAQDYLDYLAMSHELNYCL